MRLTISLFALALSGAAHADLAREAEPRGDVQMVVSLDPAAQSGHANASVRIRAQAELVARLVRSCSEALRIVPGLVACDVLETARDGSWQIIRQVEDYSWLLPKITYEFRATFRGTDRVSIERTAGDLRVLKGSWQLEQQGDETIAHYELDLAPGFWIPRWMVKLALRHDLPKMLRALRARAEQLQAQEQGTAPTPATAEVAQ